MKTPTVEIIEDEGACWYVIQCGSYNIRNNMPYTSDSQAYHEAQKIARELKLGKMERIR